MKMRHFVFAATTAMLSASAMGEPPREPRDGAEAQAIRDAAIVREALARLRAQGYAATPDGLKEFQQAKGISPTGKLDQKTLAALGVQGALSS